MCKLCRQRLKYSGNTTNLHFHLCEHHPSELGSLQSHESHEKQSSRPVLTVAEAFKAASHAGPVLTRSSKQWVQLTDAVCYFIAKDIQLYDMVNDMGFRHMIRVFEPRYIPPDWKTVATHSSWLEDRSYTLCTQDVWAGERQCQAATYLY